MPAPISGGMARTRKGGGVERTISVVLERREDTSWLARLGERPDIVAEGGSLAQARKRLMERVAREARDLAKLPVREQIMLPRAGRDAVMLLDRARHGLLEAERAAAVMMVRGLGMTVRDASASLGISMRKIVHLAGEAADADAERRYGTRSRAAARTAR